MTVSVVIATKHRARELEETMESLLQQIVLPSEVIIVDQSTDSASQEGVARAVARHSGLLPVVRYLRDSTIQGAAPARNVGIEIATGDIVAFLDDDVILEPAFFSAMVAIYEADGAVAGVSGIITNYPRPPRWQRAFLRVFWRGPFSDERQPIYWNADALRDHPPIRVRKFGTTGMSVRRRALGQVRFDHRLVGAWPGEDVDLCCRLPEGSVLVIAPTARFIHKRTPTNRSDDHWIKLDVQAMHYLYRRHWDDCLANRIRYFWLNAGYAVLATLGSVRRATLEPWRLLLEARRQARIYQDRPVISEMSQNSSVTR